ncbi:SseB family protein [Actinomycetes bacterium KLBMP 9797]
MGEGRWVDDEVVAALHDAARRGDPDAYVAALPHACLVMPGDPDEGGWAVADTPAGTSVVVYTSVEALPDGVPGYTIWAAFDLFHGWPDPAWSLLVDAGLSTEVTLAAEAVPVVAARAARAYPLDAALWAADAEPRSYLDAIVPADVVVPMRPGGSPSLDLADPEFAWWRVPDEPAIALFTSPVRLRARLGDAPWLVAAFADVLRHWPDGHAALVDPDHPIGAHLPADAMAAMSDAARTSP